MKVFYCTKHARERKLRNEDGVYYIFQFLLLAITDVADFTDSTLHTVIPLYPFSSKYVPYMIDVVIMVFPFLHVSFISSS